MTKSLQQATNDYGCPTTEMRSRQTAFEATYPHLDFHMKADAPHYSNVKTRQHFTQWERDTNNVQKRIDATNRYFDEHPPKASTSNEVNTFLSELQK